MIHGGVGVWGWCLVVECGSEYYGMGLGGGARGGKVLGGGEAVFTPDLMLCLPCPSEGFSIKLRVNLTPLGRWNLAAFWLYTCHTYVSYNCTQPGRWQ